METEESLVLLDLPEIRTKMGALKITNRKDLLLLFLYSPGKQGILAEPISGRTRLIKAFFLFNEEIWKKFKQDIQLTDDKLYQFFPWNYGPFSKEVYDDLMFFVLREFVIVKVTNEEMIIEEAAEWNFWLKSSGMGSEVNEFSGEVFLLTSKGTAFTQKLFDQLSKNQKQILQEFKSRIQELPLRALLRYVYKSYPAQIENSKIIDEILD